MRQCVGKVEDTFRHAMRQRESTDDGRMHFEYALGELGNDGTACKEAEILIKRFVQEKGIDEKPKVEVETRIVACLGSKYRKSMGGSRLLHLRHCRTVTVTWQISYCKLYTTCF
jgi:hypothetical protein